MARRDIREEDDARGPAGSLGADRVIDYAREDITRGDARYNLLLAIAGTAV